MHESLDFAITPGCAWLKTMSRVEMVLNKAKALERQFKALGGEGRGLRERALSLGIAYPVGIQNDLAYISHWRNAVAHELDDLPAEHEQPYLAACTRVSNFLDSYLARHGLPAAPAPPPPPPAPEVVKPAAPLTPEERAQQDRQERQFLLLIRVITFVVLPAAFWLLDRWIQGWGWAALRSLGTLVMVIVAVPLFAFGIGLSVIDISSPVRKKSNARV